MALDYNYYYDFSKEIKFDFILTSREGDLFRYKADFNIEKEDAFVILQKYVNHEFKVEKVFLDGEELAPNGKDSSISYMAMYTSRRGFRRFLTKGTHQLEVMVSAPGKDDPLALDKDLFLAMDRDMEKPAASEGKVRRTFSLPAKPGFREETAPLFSPEEEKTFISGVGAQDSPIPGRFGFSKGDGVLDCAMPVLGFVDKLFLCGHPDYHKNFRWSYSLLPENALLHGSYNPAQTGLEKDDIQVDQLHVKWTADFDDIKFSCSYSLGSPAILTERSDSKMRLSNLEYTGNYQYALLPLADGISAKVLPLEELPENLSLMGQNFILLFGSTEFPDLPLLLVFSKRPSNMKVIYSSITERLAEITMENCPLLFTATPCGIECPDPISPHDTGALQDLLERCSFWSRAFLAYPVKCREYFRRDPEKEEITILQKFEYRIIEDEWGTEPLRLAPLPPVITLMEDGPLPGKTDFKYPTKYGYLRGSIGRESSYTIPDIPTQRLFPLQEKGSPLADLMEKGMDEYLAFQDKFPPSFLAYPYAGAVLEPYAYALSMLPFCRKETQEKIREKVNERLRWAFRTDAAFEYTAIVHSFMMQTNPEDAALLEIYKDPALRHYKLQNWFERKDPFTKAEYHICYLNVGLFSAGIIKTGSKEEINDLALPLIENDWGAGLTYYYIYLSALATGNFDIVKENMPLLKNAARYFEKLHDWACMGTGYSDNAILWVEGANYGFFTSFINIAEAVGDKETLEQARYIGAKQYALRRGIARYAAHYLYKFYRVKPWYGVRLLCEESNPSWQFQNYQGGEDVLYKGRFRQEAIYNMTTEGMYPEFFYGLRQNSDLDAECYFRPARELLHTGQKSSYAWGNMQLASSVLIDLALQENISSICLKKEIANAKKMEIFMQKWRGIHIASRRLPENYFESQLLAWDAMKQHPLHLEHWVDLYWEKGIWDPEKSTASITISATGKAPRLRIGLRGDDRIRKAFFAGKELALPAVKEGRYGTTQEFDLPALSGELVLNFA